MQLSRGLLLPLMSQFRNSSVRTLPSATCSLVVCPVPPLLCFVCLLSNQYSRSFQLILSRLQLQNAFNSINASTPLLPPSFHCAWLATLQTSSPSIISRLLTSLPACTRSPPLPKCTQPRKIALCPLHARTYAAECGWRNVHSECIHTSL